MYGDTKNQGCQISYDTCQATWSVRIPKYEYYEHMYLGFAISVETGAVFSSASLMPWSTGGFPNHYYVFALHGSDGSVIFNTTGHCSNSSALVSSPVLDNDGAVYYTAVVRRLFHCMLSMGIFDGAPRK